MLRPEAFEVAKTISDSARRLAQIAENWHWQVANPRGGGSEPRPEKEMIEIRKKTVRLLKEMTVVVKAEMLARKLEATAAAIHRNPKNHSDVDQKA